MGVVYLALDADDHEVALKVLRSHVAHDATARARLEREASTLQRVSHPGVAGLLDYDLQTDRPYLVTRYVPGRPLDEQVEERGPLTPQRWLPLAGCLAESLQAIHRVGVVHRDLKPGNVLMLNGRPVVIDFGIAQAADDLRLTATGLVVGTPGYLSPELIDGEAVTESADWWSWAATVSFAATGRRPFGKGPFEAVLHRVHTGQFDLDGVDPRLRPLLAAALAPQKRDRPSADEILAGLSRYAEGRDALVPNQRSATQVVELPVPPTRVMTRVLPPEDAVPPTERAPYEDPVEVARLVPRVIPPLSAFAPVPSHPATYSPTPTAAPPPSMPLPYQGNQPLPGENQVLRTQDPRQAGVRPAAPPVPPHLLPTRSGLLFALLMALVGLAAVLPVVAVLVFAGLMVIARLVDRSSTALLRRREVRGGRGRSDGLVAVAASPVHLVTAALATVPCLLLPLMVGFTVGGIATVAAAIFQGLSWGHLATTGVAAGALSGLLTGWWGPGGTSFRRGARAGLRSAFRPAWLSTLVAVALLAAAALCWLYVITGTGPDWAPLGNPLDSANLPERPTTDDLRDLPIIRDLPYLGR
jgi:serine/threonine protein kinase